MPDILLAEDEEILGQLISDVLCSATGYHVNWVRDGVAAMECIRSKSADICILDVMMPIMDGFTVARKIREIHMDLPIIFLTARTHINDIATGFQSGADDYLRKPFMMEELVLRVQNLLKRPRATLINKIPDQVMMTVGIYQFFPESQILRCPYAGYSLTSRESDILQELVKHLNSTVNRNDIVMKLWNIDTSINSRIIDVYIGRIRKYLMHDKSLSILNIRGYGYKLVQKI